MTRVAWPMVIDNANDGIVPLELNWFAFHEHRYSVWWYPNGIRYIRIPWQRAFSIVLRVSIRLSIFPEQLFDLIHLWVLRAKNKTEGLDVLLSG